MSLRFPCWGLNPIIDHWLVFSPIIFKKPKSHSMLKLLFKPLICTFGLTCYFLNVPVLFCFFFRLTDSLTRIYSDISCTTVGVNFIFCMQFTWLVTSGLFEMNMIGLYKAVIGRIRQLSEPRLWQQTRKEKSQTSVERDILVQWVTICFIFLLENIFCDLSSELHQWDSSNDRPQYMFLCRWTEIVPNHHRILFHILHSGPTLSHNLQVLKL